MNPQKKKKAVLKNESSSPLEPEKVITTIDIRFETTEFDRSNDELNKVIENIRLM